MNSISSIGRKDVYWNYAATFLQIGAQAILLPFILRTLPQEQIGIWMVFASIIAIVTLLDFGFNPSFTRNVTYVLSGVKTLKATGLETTEEKSEVDYGLLKGLISVMRSFYARIALALFAILSTAGTYYVSVILRGYTGDRNEIIIAWLILCVVNAYGFYTFYYDALLVGMGKIKRSRQIIVLGQMLYLAASIAFISLGLGLIALASAQAVSIVVRRVLTYISVYVPDMKKKLKDSVAREKKEVFMAVYPNAVKLGLTGVGTVLALRVQPIIGSIYLPLEAIASYGITIQLVGLIHGIAMVYFHTHNPKVIQARVRNDVFVIKKIYIKSCLFLMATFFLGGLCLILFGSLVLNLIESRTQLLPKSYILLAILFELLVANHAIAGGILLTKNKVPFFKPSLFSGLMTVILVFLFLRFSHLGVLSLILAGGLSQAVYQNWKWPMEVIKEIRSAEKELINL